MATISSAPVEELAGGCQFLIEEADARTAFTPEDFTEEQQGAARTALKFSQEEILPAEGEIESKNYDVTRKLLRRAGELGLLAVDVPEQYGGLALDKVTSALIAEATSANGSFSVSFGAHTVIGTLPLVWYGSEAQKAKYLPKLVSGEWIAAYSLSEANSGSDAMNIRARATLSSDSKSYLLNGEKMWVSNAGFADLFTVFAKIDGERFSAFLVERSSPGLSVGREERKLGIQGSSTCPLLLNDCRISSENLLGEAGKGHRIAFNILNVGRFKLGAGCLGRARLALNHAISYARDRKAFGRSLANFGLIQEKLAESAAGIYIGECLTYRLAHKIDRAIAEMPSAEQASEEYAAECSILKVWGSEMLDMVVDHLVQIYAGYGYVEDFPAARTYRDARINRIFEGTNEINRLIIGSWPFKLAKSGKLALEPAVARATESALQAEMSFGDGEGALEGVRRTLRRGRDLALFALGVAWKQQGDAIVDQQEVLGALADCMIEIYALESGLMRAEKLKLRRGGEMAAQAATLTALYSARALEKIASGCRKVIAFCGEDVASPSTFTTLEKLLKWKPVNVISLSRKIAAHLAFKERYSL